MNTYKLILIVTHNKDPHSIPTINSLRQLGVLTCKEYKTVVWVNESDLTNVQLEGVDVILSDINESLSCIYNEIIHNRYKGYESVTIFDDDTDISDWTFFEHKNVTGPYVIAPTVTYNGEKVYPIKINDNSIIDNDEYISGVKSINSGLTINREAVDILKKKYGCVFDSRFSFYGVDFSLFYRLNESREITINQIGNIEHSLSRLESSYEINSFRWKQKIFENILMVRNYPKYNSKIILVKVLVKLLMSLKVSTIKEALKVMLNNKSCM
ncbi:hypothetical protein R7M92_08925 [Vibrio sp. Vb2880]|uniref:hypothetical protein n=1 Tax=Vibrio TaxID=662 RepID=UPI0029653BF4|nr:hypothetical protein [Vibrio sp. Vb2880]MDW1575884.1 hypothetical protein [Vibrio sp. Vb2880]